MALLGIGDSTSRWLLRPPKVLSVIMPNITPARLTGERLVLEPLAVEDAVEMVEVLSSPFLYVLIGGQPPSLPELAARYQRQIAGPVSDHEAWLNWIVRLEGQAVGFVQATLRQEGGLLCAAPWWQDRRL